jgi:hypothetical protein
LTIFAITVQQSINPFIPFTFTHNTLSAHALPTDDNTERRKTGRDLQEFLEASPEFLHASPEFLQNVY